MHERPRNVIYRGGEREANPHDLGISQRGMSRKVLTKPDRLVCAAAWCSARHSGKYTAGAQGANDTTSTSAQTERVPYE